MNDKIEIYYCPGCGHALKSYEATCPTCHSEIRKQEVPNSIKEFSTKLNEIRNKKLEKEDSLLKKVIGRDLKDENEEEEFEEKKKEELINFIKNYPISPSKEEIIGFLILIANNIENTNSELNKTWKNKFEQVYNISKISLKEREDIKLAESIYNNKMNELKEKRDKNINIIKVIIKIFIGLTILSISLINPIISLIGILGILGISIIKNKSLLPKDILSKIGIIILSILSIVSMVTRCSQKQKEEEEKKINFSDFVLEDKIPKIEGTKKGEVYDNTDELLSFEINKVSAKEYYNYLRKCQEKGYTEEEEKEESTYHAFSKNGFELTLNYSSYQKEMSIKLKKIKNYKEFTWPEIKLTKLLPKPNSTKGEILEETNNDFIVELKISSLKDYEKYIEDCIDLGYIEKSEKKDKSYKAENKEKYRLEIEYLGNNVMKISLKEPLYQINLKIKCIENLIFSKYDLNVYIDDLYEGEINHGSKEEYELNLTKGKHTIRIESDENSEVDGKITITVENDDTIELEVYCTSDNVNITKKEKKKETKEETKKEEKEEVVENIKENTKTNVYYSTNDETTVKNGNKGIYSYINKGKAYSTYLIIDIDGGYVYTCADGNGDDSCWKSKITSGNLNTVLIVTLYDNGKEYQEGYHFKYVNNPSQLILEDNDHFETTFTPTDIDKALNLRNSRRHVDF